MLAKFCSPLSQVNSSIKVPVLAHLACNKPWRPAHAHAR
jgi:hypothetical protein